MIKRGIRNKQRAFTLIELIVAVGVFAIVSTITSGTLLILTKAEKKAINVQTGYDNLRYALETMAKEIRTGTDYELCSSGSEPYPDACFIFIKPLSAGTAAVIYKYSTLGNECAENIGSVMCIAKSIEVSCNVAETAAQCKARAVSSSPAFYPVTAPEISVNVLRFYLSGVGNDSYQPRLTIVIRAETPGGLNPLSAALNLQTTISQFQYENF